MSDPFQLEHRALIDHAEGLIQTLARFERRLKSGEVSHAQHRTYAQRAAALADQLTAVMTLAPLHQYSAAFGLLRPALEQTVFDRLLCLATLFVRTIHNVSDDQFRQWEQERKAHADWAKNVHRMTRSDNDTVRMELRGYTSTDPAVDLTISIYYFLLEEYQPFVAAAKEQKHFVPEHGSRKRQAEYAAAQHELYHTHLRWPALISNLRMNDLATNTDIARIGVHYRFLSAFVHPLKNHYRKLYGNHSELGRPLRYDHYSSELILLYTIAFAIYEIRSLVAAAERSPTFGIFESERLAEQLDAATLAMSHLWFVGDAPGLFDRIRNVNANYWRPPEESEPTALADPTTIPADDVLYFQDPLQRIIMLHRTAHEMMGYSFVSPWPRADALFR